MEATEILSEHRRYQALSDWLRKWMTISSTSNAQLARSLGNSQGQVSDWRNKGMSYKSAQQVSEKMDWDLPTLESLIELGEVDETTVPLSSAAASMGYGLEDNEFEVISQARVSREWLGSKTTSRNLALLPVTGRSMEPTYESGATLLVDRSVNTFDRDAIYVFRSLAGLFVKRVTRLVSGGVVVSSDNKEYAAQTLAPADLEAIRVLGLIVGVWGYKDL